MNIAIVGYGKMGHEIEAAALRQNINIAAKIDPTVPEATHKEITKESLGGADVVVEFTHPGTVVENIKKIASLKKNLLVGTTGWYDSTDKIKKIVEKEGIGFLYSSNFSIGVNLFFKIVDQSSKLINFIPEYDIYGFELHHNQKADSPSGTARTIANTLMKNIERKTGAVYEKLDRKPLPGELHFPSIRAGFIPGTHVVGFDSTADTIELKHTARSRVGFAIGALIAAKWLVDKKGFFEMDDFMSEYFR